MEIGIVDTRNIISLINEKYNYDFSDYALTSFKRRIERVIELYNLKYPDILLNKLLDDKSFIDVLVDELSVPSTEMFRDPSLWRVIREELIISLYRESGSNFKIWLPNSVSGDELFSLVIILSETGMLEKVQILVSALSNKSIETIKSGIFKSDKLEISTDNYIRSNGKYDLLKYFTSTTSPYIRDISLLKNVTFYKQNTFLDPAPQGVKLILFRNKMIYFNQTLQTKVLKTISSVSSSGSFLVTGTKESLNCIYGNTDFALVNQMESIYKRRF